MKTRQFIAALGACALLFAHAAFAQDFPSRPIRILVPVAPGSSIDSSTRFIAERMQRALGQPVLVENRPGGNTLIATQAMLAAPRDGYTLTNASFSNVIINPLTIPNLPYTVEKDLSLLGGMTRAAAVLAVSAQSRFETLQDFTDESRRLPGRLSIGSYSELYRLGGAVFEKRASVELNHIPYKGAAQVMADLVGGNVDAAFLPGGAASALVKAGKLRVLMVTSNQRLTAPEFSAAPTPAEAGLAGFELYSWFGLAAGAGIPEAARIKLENTLRKEVESPEFRAFLEQQGGETPFISNGEALFKLISQETLRYRDILGSLTSSGR